MSTGLRDTVERNVGQVSNKLSLVASRIADAAHGGPLDEEDLHGAAAILRECRDELQEGAVQPLYDAGLREGSGDCHLPGSHAAYDPGYFKDDGLFYGHVRCHHCATVEELDGVAPKERGGEPVKEHVTGWSGVYLDACCPGCGSAFLAMEDGKLAPVVGSRAW